MTNLVYSDKSSHWYTKEGKPQYEVEMSTKKGQFRPATVRDARKLELVPSVTTIMSVVAKPGLEAWKLNQALLSALTLPKLPDETTDAFAKRVVVDMKEEGKQAAAKGTDIHDLLDNYVHDKFDVRAFPFLIEFEKWWKDSELKMQATEKSFSNLEEGYGGRVDFIGWYKGNRCILDWKTQQTKEGQPPNFYPEYGCQLTAYGVGIFGMADARQASYISAVISRNEIGRVDLMEYSFEMYWPAFKAAKDLWYSVLGPGYSIRKLEG